MSTLLCDSANDRAHRINSRGPWASRSVVLAPCSMRPPRFTALLPRGALHALPKRLSHKLATVRSSAPVRLSGAQHVPIHHQPEVMAKKMRRMGAQWPTCPNELERLRCDHARYYCVAVDHGACAPAPRCGARAGDEARARPLIAAASGSGNVKGSRSLRAVTSAQTLCGVAMAKRFFRISTHTAVRMERK
jgi:hypothetical protein